MQPPPSSPQDPTLQLLGDCLLRVSLFTIWVYLWRYKFRAWDMAVVESIWRLHRGCSEHCHVSACFRDDPVPKPEP